MFPGCVHLSPNLVTVARWTGISVSNAASSRKYAVGAPRVTRSVSGSSTSAPTVFQSVDLPSLKSSAPLIGKNISAYLHPVAGVRARSHDQRKSSAVSGSPLDHFASLRRWKV